MSAVTPITVSGGFARSRHRSGSPLGCRARRRPEAASQRRARRYSRKSRGRLHIIFSGGFPRLGHGGDELSPPVGGCSGAWRQRRLGAQPAWASPSDGCWAPIGYQPATAERTALRGSPTDWLTT